MTRHGVLVVTDTHTEHCCILHGCKYGAKGRRGVCTVVSGEKPQSFPCEYCYEWIEENWDVILLMDQMYERGYQAGKVDSGGAYQTPAGERELRLYENLDLVLTQLAEPYSEHLWHVVWKLTGGDPAVFSAARRWLKVHDPVKQGGES